MANFRRIGFRLALSLTLAALFCVQPAGTQAQTFTTATAGTATRFGMFNGTRWVLSERDATLETRIDDGRGPTLVQVKHSRHPLNRADLAPAEYAKTAASLGLEVPAEEATLLQALNDNHLGTYNFAKVDDYLYRQALKLGTRYRWVWEPVGAAGLKAVNESGADYDAKADLGLVMAREYQRPVPLRVLNEMKALRGCLAGAVFLVSDYEAVKPDPFLAVTTEKLLSAGKIWIVDQWDEPGFTDKAEPVSVPTPPPAPTTQVAQR